MLTPQDYLARIETYRRELPRRAVVLLLCVFLPTALLVLLVMFLLGLFAAPDTNAEFSYSQVRGVIIYAIFFLVLTIANVLLFYHQARHGLPKKIGLLCPQCDTFPLFEAKPEVFTQTGKCQKCGNEIFRNS